MRLQPQRNEHQATQHDPVEQRDAADADREIAIFEQGQIHDGIFFRQFPHQEQDEPHHADAGERDNHIRTEPIEFFAFIEHDLKAAHRGDQ